MQVLVVDDNLSVAKTTAMVFKALGCSVEIEDKPQNVMDKAGALKPDLIIMDIGMPDINGYELCRRLRARDDHQSVIVAHTGWGNEADKLKAKQAGFDDILVKPAALREYQAVVERCQSNE